MKFDKAKVFTTLNADEVKVESTGYFADTLESIKDIVEHERSDYYGKLVEIKNDSYERRFRLKDNYNYILFYLAEDRKEEFRPYKNTDEMVEHFYRHFNLIPQEHRLPTLWIKFKTDADKKYLIARLSKSEVTLCFKSGNVTIDLESLAKEYTWLDGSPCGIKE